MGERIDTIAVLYPGEMGAAVASLLLGRSAERIVTVLEGRSPRTLARCRKAGIDILDSLADLARQADLVISLVPPAAAEAVANAYSAVAHLAPAEAIYVDANSIRPELAARLARRIAFSGRSFVDAAINGLATNLSTSATLYLSGDRADEVAGLFSGAMRVRTLGEIPGRASAMKMLLAGLSKGMCALFVELGLLAERREMLDEFIEAGTMIYPGVMQVVDRMLPTYREHAGRRAEEMRELEQTARTSELETCLIAAISRLHGALADLAPSIAMAAEAAPAGAGPTARLIRQLAEKQLLGSEALSDGNTGRGMC